MRIRKPWGRGIARNLEKGGRMKIVACAKHAQIFQPKTTPIIIKPHALYLRQEVLLELIHSQKQDYRRAQVQLVIRTALLPPLYYDIFQV